MSSCGFEVMGCGKSSAASTPTAENKSSETKAPEPDPLTNDLMEGWEDDIDGADAGGAFDDLNYLRGAESFRPDSDVQPGLKRAVSATWTKTIRTARIQVQLDDRWADVSEEESTTIRKKIDAGSLTFDLEARNTKYQISMDPTDMYQTNTQTGKKRSLRVLDEGDDEPPPQLDSIGGGQSTSMSNIGTPKAVPAEVKRQASLGGQSRRGNASMKPMDRLEGNPHAQELFDKLLKNEDKMCGEWAVFYHSYSFAALLYEVNAAVGAVLFRFRSQYATLPRVLVHEFDDIPNAEKLMANFRDRYATAKRDHHPEFRRVGISAMCSLVATGPECCLQVCFTKGYSCKDVGFRKVLETLLESCYVPKERVSSLADEIIGISTKYGLDTSQFGGQPCASQLAGHILQIFVKRNLVDKLCYPAKPYGEIDEERIPLSQWMNGEQSFSFGQARLLAHPKFFMQANHVRMNVISADATFHQNRKQFQEDLTGLLGVVLDTPELRQKAAMGIYGGTLPPWWTAEDQRKHSKKA